MASAELSRRVEKVVGYPPLCDMGDAFGHVGRARIVEARRRAATARRPRYGGAVENRRPVENPPSLTNDHTATSRAKT
jgi:hypothetical protein